MNAQDSFYAIPGPGNLKPAEFIEGLLLLATYEQMIWDHALLIDDSHFELHSVLVTSSGLDL